MSTLSTRFLIAHICSALLVLVVLGPVCAQAEQAGALDTAAIDAAMGVKGSLNVSEGVYKVSISRTDVRITVDGAPMPPFMGVTSWAAFKSDPKGGAMIMGDLVLFEDEVNPVMSGTGWCPSSCALSKVASSWKVCEIGNVCMFERR